MTRLAALVTAALVLAAALVVGGTSSAPAAADPIGQCTATTGTIVAVDFSHWGGPFVRGCGAHASSGFQLLDDAGFTTAGDQHDGPAFICRIGNPAFDSGTQYPTPSEDACVVTPPASAYWSYWLALRGQNTWSYGQLGATSDVPKPGEVELWQFGGTNVSGTEGRPTVSPDDLRAKNAAPVGGDRSSTAGHAPRPSSVTRPAAGPTTHSAARGTHHRPDGAAKPTSNTSRSTASAASAGHRVAAAPGSTTAGDPASNSDQSHASGPAVGLSPSGTGPPDIVDARPASASTAKPSTGSALPVIIGLVLTVLMAGGAGWTALRRRNADSAE